VTRNQLVAGALALVVAAGALGWVIGAQIQSPAEAAANAQPPTPSLITVAVDQRKLSADVIGRGTIDFDSPESLSLSGLVGEPGMPQIVTMIPEEGTDLPEGAVAVEVAGRPVIVLQGELPVYRDMRPGSVGDDVLQLEQALVRLGYMSSADKTWDNATGAGVQALYASAGYTANSTSKADQEAVKSARDFVRSANQALQDAVRALNEAGGATGSALIEAQNAVADAQARVNVAVSERTAAVGMATGQVTVANAVLTTAQTRHQEAIDTGLHPDTGLPTTSADMTALAQAVTDAQVALTDAQNSLAAVQTTQDALVASAQRDLTVAQARLTEAQSPGDRTALIRARDDAQRQLTEATASLVELEAGLGTWMPAGELIFVDRMPVQVARLQVQRGDTISGTFMTVSGSDIAMTIGLSETDAKRVKVGDRVVVDEPDLLDEPWELEIAAISEPSSSGRVTVTVLLDTVREELLGANLRVVIPVQSTEGEVLVVPAAALSAVANGDTRVEVEDPDKPGTTHFVTVITGLAADGVVEVRAVDGSLAKGDRVVVGHADIGPAGAGGDEESDEPTADPSIEAR